MPATKISIEAVPIYHRNVFLKTLRRYLREIPE
jgi:hypothetical protein